MTTTPSTAGKAGDVEVLKGLLEQVRAALWQDDDLEADIMMGVGILTRTDLLADSDAGPIWQYFDAGRNVQGRHCPMVPAVTDSIDAAVGLIERVLPRWSWEVRRSGFGTPAQAILYDPMKQPAPGCKTHVDHPSGVPALALCAALLTALIARTETDRGRNAE